MEQLVARRAHNPKVVGSSPTPATKKALSETLRAIFIRSLKLALRVMEEKGPGERREPRLSLVKQLQYGLTDQSEALPSPLQNILLAF